MNNDNQKLTQKEFYLFKSVSLIDKFNFYEYLSIMLDWWVTIVAALESVNKKIATYNDLKVNIESLEVKRKKREEKA